MFGTLAFRLLSTLIGFAFSAFAQLDADRFVANLRADYGPPLTREVFKVPAGEMVVDFATNGHACRIQLPAMGPEEGRANVTSAKAIDDFLLKLLPLSMRGKELGKMAEQIGLSAVLISKYENVTISEMSHDQRRTGVTVTFTRETCHDRPPQ